MEESGEAGETWQSLEDTWTELGLFLKVTLLADSVRPLTRHSQGLVPSELHLQRC